MASNLLSAEKSPYLLQHKDNPVHWHAWNDAAFARARAEEKPIFLSIGYSTCYWCHVMEHDSFESDDVAAVLNRDFVCIKLDREERPDVDQIFMDVVVGMTGHGGWPMSMFLTPQGEPFWGGTFFWRAQFLNILSGIAAAWKNERERVTSSASGITAALRENAQPVSGGKIDAAAVQQAVDALKENFDSEFGGFGPAPKFPPSQQLALLLRWHHRTEDPEALSIAGQTLEQMARGGIYDQLGGGFARYSTDARWIVPHFEKMLYDNALLAVVYLEAFQVTGAPWMAAVARETLDFILREMTSPQGGFFSALDAGEVDREGEFYVWQEKDLKSLVTPDEFSLLASVYEISAHGNFEHGANVFTVKPSVPLERARSADVAALRNKLLTARNLRSRPRTDDKVLAAWNGMCIKAFAVASQALADEKYLTAAVRAAEHLKQKLFRDGKLLRRYRDGESSGLGFLEDYAFVIEGLFALYEAGFDEQWLLWARELQKIQDALFWDEEGQGYFVTYAKEIAVRKKDLFDGAIPSANSTAYCNLLKLNAFFPEERFDLRAEAVCNGVWTLVRRAPGAFSRLLQGVESALAPMYEIAIIAQANGSLLANNLVRHVHERFLPHKILAASPADKVSSLPILQGRGLQRGESAAYVCVHGACELPVTQVEELEKTISNKRRRKE